MTVIGNALRLPFADGAAQCVVTSPPYYGLRDYGVVGQIGLEQTPAEYVAQIVAVFRECWRVLRDDGVAWLNIGDSYSQAGKWGGNAGYNNKQSTNAGSIRRTSRTAADIGAKEKDLLGIPWRVAFALQDDGWYLRSDCIWHKPNPMPESVTDRPTKAHEYVFLLSKQARYYYDAEAVKEQVTTSTVDRLSQDVDAQIGSARANGGAKTNGNMKAVGERPPSSATFRREGSKRGQAIPGQEYGTHRPDRADTWPQQTRNARTVWTIATTPYSGAHFATMPPRLAEKCVLSGSRRGDVVLDPFSGSGTTERVAIQHGRRFIGTELNPAYVKLRAERTAAIQLMVTP